MTIVVRFFARARDVAGGPSVSLDIPEGSTIADLRHLLAESYPALESLLPRCRFALAKEFADDQAALSPNAEVALLPPVSGG